MTKTVNFRMTIDMDIIPPLYTYYNNDNQPTNGSVTTTCGDPVNIIYTLGTSGFQFLDPAITNNFDCDISFEISEDKQTLTILNSAEHVDKVGIQFIVQDLSTGQKYASPDPRIRSKPSL